MFGFYLEEALKRKRPSFPYENTTLSSQYHPTNENFVEKESSWSTCQIFESILN